MGEEEGDPDEGKSYELVWDFLKLPEAERIEQERQS
jgi:hypothetical protein